MRVERTTCKHGAVEAVREEACRAPSAPKPPEAAAKKPPPPKRAAPAPRPAPRPGGPAPRARSRTRRSCWPAWRAGRRGRRRCDSKKLLMCLGCARRLFPRRHGLGRDWPSTKFWREPPGGCARARANASSLLIGFAAPKKHMQIIDPIDASERAPHPTWPRTRELLCFLELGHLANSRETKLRLGKISAEARSRCAVHWAEYNNNTCD